MWIQRVVLEKLLELAATRKKFKQYGLLFLLAYAFLLRLPSEALPVVTGLVTGQASLFREGETLVLVLRRRKNKPGGSRLVRTCWCSESTATCPVHVIGPVLDQLAPGMPLFNEISAASALHVLREMLTLLGVDQAMAYRTHDLRRGHALDLQLSGAPLYEILAAGEWKSPAFLAYLDIERLERDVVVQAHVDESDDDVE